MELVPILKADTIPVVAPIVAASVLLLFHVPPVMAFASKAVVPVHTSAGPVMGAMGYTVTVAVA